MYIGALAFNVRALAKACDKGGTGANTVVADDLLLQVSSAAQIQNLLGCATKWQIPQRVSRSPDRSAYLPVPVGFQQDTVFMDGQQRQTSDQDKYMGWHLRQLVSFGNYCFRYLETLKAHKSAGTVRLVVGGYALKSVFRTHKHLRAVL